MTNITPAVHRSVHLFIAPLLWTLIGIMLIYRGWGWIGPGPSGFLIIPAIILGTVKSILVLDKSAARSINRIKQFDDYTCVGAVYSWKTWGLVGLMMTFGIIMRKLIDPGMCIGSLYVAIGWALVFSSRLGWLAWWSRMRHD